MAEARTRAQRGWAQRQPPASLEGREVVTALALVELARFLRQHDGDAVADWIGKSGSAADQLLTLGVIVERGLGQGTDKNLKELRIEPYAGLPLIRHVHHLLYPSRSLYRRSRAVVAGRKLHLGERHKRFGAGLQISCLEQRLLL